ncbi:MAG: hypothetical protein ACR2NB_10420 [Solirubrobacteraceae bacterium]
MDPKTLVVQYLDEAHATETAPVTNLGAHIAMTTDDDYRSCWCAASGSRS